MSIATMDGVRAGPGDRQPRHRQCGGVEGGRHRIAPSAADHARVCRRFCAAILKGDAVNFQGEMFQINGAKMGFVPPMPIAMYITAVRPRMLQLGGEIGDGVLLSGGCAPGYIAQCVEEIAKGAAKPEKSRYDVDVAGFVTAAVSDNAKEAIEANKCFSPTFFATCTTPKISAWVAAKSISKGLAAAVARRDWEAAKKFISDEVVFAHSVAGTPTECR